MFAIFRGSKQVSEIYSDMDYDDVVATLSDGEEIRPVTVIEYCIGCGYPTVTPFPIQCIDGKVRIARCTCGDFAYEEDGSLWRPKLL